MGQAPSEDGIRLPLDSEADIVAARQKGRLLAAEIGLSASELTVVATVISELARNIVLYAQRGQITVRLMEKDGRRGIMVTASDEGPGIPDISRAVQDGYSTSGGLGLGLPGVRRLMDEFAIESVVDRGTTVTVTKWGR